MEYVNLVTIENREGKEIDRKKGKMKWLEIGGDENDDDN